MTKINTGIPEGARGEQIRNHLIKLQNFFGNVNDMADEAQLEADQAKIKLDEIEDLVEEELQKRYPVRKRGRKISKHKVEVVTEDGVIITLSQVKHEYALARYKLSRAKSRVEEIKTSIGSIRSILAWDRLEYVNSND